MNSTVLADELGIKTNRERQVPSSIDEAEPTHKIRYTFIADYIQKNNLKADTLVDFGCGSGYGTYILSSCARAVCGYDVDKRVLNYARGVFGRKNIEYFNYNSSSLPKRCDAICCVEMIEHVSLEDAKAIIDDLYENLNHKGHLFITTPRRPYGNPYHLHEYTCDELKAILEDAGFTIREAFGQAYLEIELIEKMKQDYEKRDKFTMIFVCEKT